MTNLAFVKYRVKSIRSIRSKKVSPRGAAIAVENYRAAAIEEADEFGDDF